MTTRLEDINADILTGKISPGEVLCIHTQEGVILSLQAVSAFDEFGENIPLGSKPYTNFYKPLNRKRKLNLSPAYHPLMQNDTSAGAFLDLITGEIDGLECAGKQKGKAILPEELATHVRFNLPYHFLNYEILKRTMQ